MLKSLFARLLRKAPVLIEVPEGQRLFKCLVHGEGFPGAILSLAKPIGFYATRFVAAPTVEAAEAAVLARLRQDPSLQLPDGVLPDTSARVSFKEIMEVPNDAPHIPNAGFSFYEMGT